MNLKKTLKCLKILLIILCSLLFCSNAIASHITHKLLHPIRWTYVKNIDNILIESQIILNAEDTNYIIQNIHITYDSFTQFYKINECKKERLNIRIVDFTTMNSDLYFSSNNLLKDKVYLGRYFSSTNIIYIMPDALKDKFKYEFIHEIAHYLQDVCGMPVEEIGVHKYLEYLGDEYE